MIGTVAAQAIPILLSPLYTRLFSPEAFGAWAAFTAVAAILAVTATGRYELAILLPDSDEKAGGVLALAVSLAVVAGLLLTATGIVLREPIASALGSTFPAGLAPFIGVSAALLGTWQALLGWANRRGRYGRIGLSGVIQQAAAAVTTVGLGMLARMPAGLIAGAIAGQVVANGVLGWQVLRENRSALGRVSGAVLARTAREFYRFPVYNLPYSILTTASSRIPVLLLMLFGAIAAAGFVGFSRSVLFVPITFVSASLGRVYFRTASTSFGSPRLEQLTISLLDLMAIAGAPAFAFVLVWAPDLFAFVFGETWREAGELARLLVPSAFAFLFTSWPERIFEVARRQDLSLRIQLVADSLTVAIVAALLARGATPFAAVLAYGILSVGYNCLYLWGVFRVGGFAFKGFYHTLALALTALTASAAAFVALRWAMPSGIAAFAGSTLLLISVYVGLWRWRGENWRRLATLGGA